MKIEIIIFEGFDELDAIAPFEVLKTAAAIGANLEVQLVTLDPATEIAAAHGLRVQPHAQLNLNQTPDLLIVPGGGWVGGAAQGARAEVARDALPAAIAHLHRKDTAIAAVCTGAMLVAAAGLLDGRPAVTHQGAIADLAAAGANIIKARVVDDGDIITAGGVTSGLDLALWLLERYFGAQIAAQVEVMLEYERRGTVWRC